MDKILASGTNYIATSPLHGRGMFARRPLQAGEVIGAYPLLVLSADDIDTIKPSRIFHYVFYVDEDVSGRMRAAIAFGEVSMCNHSPTANAAFAVDSAAQIIILTAREDIAADAEIMIDYEDFAETALGTD